VLEKERDSKRGYEKCESVRECEKFKDKEAYSENVLKNGK
jgi:hypothetical protein